MKMTKEYELSFFLFVIERKGERETCQKPIIYNH